MYEVMILLLRRQLSKLKELYRTSCSNMVWRRESGLTGLDYDVRNSYLILFFSEECVRVFRRVLQVDHNDMDSAKVYGLE